MQTLKTIILFSFITCVSSWKTEKTYCNIIVNDLLQNTYEPILSEEWNYHYLQSQMRKNVLCGVVYLHDNKMIVVDKESPENITLSNMHVMKTTPELSHNVIQKFQDNYDISLDTQDAYFLDLIDKRPISNKIAEDFSVFHQSPQIVIIKDGKAVFDTSHMMIEVDKVKAAIA